MTRILKLGGLRCSNLIVVSKLLLTCLAIVGAGSSWAGGLYVNEFSTTSQANAGAGRGAWAPDASAALHNPATMTRMEDHAFATGFSLAFGRVRFDPDPASPSGTGKGGNQAGLAPLSSFSYVHRVSDRVRFGLTFFSISGSILDPSNDWAGRFQMTDLSLLTISLSPTFAFEVTDWLSIGGGPIATYGVLNWKLRADFPVGTESKVELDKFNDWEPTGRVGVLLSPCETLSLSAYYNSETEFELDGNLEGPLGVAPSLDVTLPLAQFVEVSAAWQATDELMLLATFNWEDWSTADALAITLGGVPVTATTGFKDTYKVGVGANYRLRDDWLLQTGVMFDTSSFTDGDRTVAIPVDQQIRAAIGFQHELSESLTVGASFVYVNLGKGKVAKSSVVGEFEDNDIFALGVTLAFGELPWAGKARF